MPEWRSSYLNDRVICYTSGNAINPVFTFGSGSEQSLQDNPMFRGMFRTPYTTTTAEGITLPVYITLFYPNNFHAYNCNVAGIESSGVNDHVYAYNRSDNLVYRNIADRQGEMGVLYRPFLIGMCAADSPDMSALCYPVTDSSLQYTLIKSVLEDFFLFAKVQSEAYLNCSTGAQLRTTQVNWECVLPAKGSYNHYQLPNEIELPIVTRYGELLDGLDLGSDVLFSNTFSETQAFRSGTIPAANLNYSRINSTTPPVFATNNTFWPIRYQLTSRSPIYYPGHTGITIPFTMETNVHFLAFASDPLPQQYYLLDGLEVVTALWEAS